MLPCIKNFARQFLDKIADGSLTYHAVKEELLKNTILGKTFQSINGFEVCLYDFIEVPFNSLFLELCKIVNNQPFNLSAPLEILSVKIERLLREILHMRGISILSISPDKEQFLLLDKIFDRLQENDIFGIDDINFFKYALTTQGWNLRNYAAHGLLDFRYYKTLLGIHSCFLLLICILKIAYRVK